VTAAQRRTLMMRLDRLKSEKERLKALPPEDGSPQAADRAPEVTAPAREEGVAPVEWLPAWCEGCGRSPQNCECDR
jgi:hypothetical protein